jgi:hypothetical protein
MDNRDIDANQFTLFLICKIKRDSTQPGAVGREKVIFRSTIRPMNSDFPCGI